MIHKIFLAMSLFLTLGLTACTSPNATPEGDDLQSELNPPAQTSPTNAPSPSQDAGSISDPPAAIRALTDCVRQSGTPAASVASTISDRAGLAQSMMDQGELQKAQEQYKHVYSAIKGLQEEYDFHCVD